MLARVAHRFVCFTLGLAVAFLVSVLPQLIMGVPQ